MTSAVRIERGRAAFTLIEIVVVLAIASVMMGGGLAYMVFSSDERVLRDASVEIELMAKRARAMAMLRQTSFALEFRETSVRLLPLALAGREQRRGRGGAASGPVPIEEAGEGASQYDIPAGMAVAVRRWDSSEWFPARKRFIHVWRFDPNGLCEPLGVRLTIGSSWLEDSYHPLTASIRDTAMEAK